MKKVVKKNYKIVIGLVIGILISATVVYASQTVLLGNEISYDTETSHGTSNNVQGAIDELYSKLYDKPKITAYTYNENKGDSNYCVNGEERTCKKTDCYTKKEANSCPQGTIIKYYVRENEYHYFYVLHDDGKTITMQQRENTVRNIPWNDNAKDNTTGPITILNALEKATSTWTNVNVLTYKLGETEFNGSKFTGCKVSGKEDGKMVCEENIYNDFGLRNSRSRMITAQEAESTGCLVCDKNTNNRASCPDWMYNYLYESTTYGGSYSNDTLNENGIYDYDYWTMSADLEHPTYAWDMTRAGCFDNGNYLKHNEISSKLNGARAVVEINKQ